MIDKLQKLTYKYTSKYVGFWPKTAGTHQTQHIEEEVDKFQGCKEWNDHYVGPQLGRPQEGFRPDIDVRKGDFILVRPADPEYPIWLGVAESNVDVDISSPNHKNICIQYWAPKH